MLIALRAQSLSSLAGSVGARSHLESALPHQIMAMPHILDLLSMQSQQFPAQFVHLVLLRNGASLVALAYRIVAFLSIGLTF